MNTSDSESSARAHTSESTRDPLTELLAAFAALEYENTRVLGRIAQTARVGRSDLRGLLFLSQQPGEVTPKQIAEHLLLSTGATTALLDRMVAADLVRRVPHRSDRRSVVVELAPSGHAAVGRVADFYRQVFRDAVAREDAATMTGYIRVLGDALTRVAAREIE
jgi:DNA-binding MarR family transcriptional regulator